MAEKKSLKPYMKEITAMIIVFLFLLAIVVSIFTFVKSNQPKARAEKEAIATAEKYANLTSTEDFYWFTRDKVYFTVTGKTKDNQDVAVIIPKAGGKITVIPEKDGISKEKAQGMIQGENPNETIDDTNLGIYKDQVAWEVITKNDKNEYSYHLLAFKDGAEISTIRGI